MNITNTDKISDRGHGKRAFCGEEIAPGSHFERKLCG
jgi:hypothetical protein